MREAPVHNEVTDEVAPEHGMPATDHHTMLLAIGLVGVLGIAMLAAAALKARAVNGTPVDDRPAQAVVEARSLWITPERIGPGAVVTVAVRNDGPTEFAVPSALAVERLEGGRWEPAGTASLCYEAFSCTGRILGPGEEVPAREVRSGAPAHGIGPAATVRIDRGPGRYRLVVGRDPAAARRGPTAEIEISDDPAVPVAPPPLDPAAPHLAVSPVVIPGGAATLTSVVAGAPTIEACIDSSSTPQWRLERWQGTGWVPSSEILHATHPGEGASACAFSVEVHPVQPGAHRLVSGTGDSVMQGYVWVE